MRSSHLRDPNRAALRIGNRQKEGRSPGSGISQSDQVSVLTLFLSSCVTREARVVRIGFSSLASPFSSLHWE